MIFDISVGDCHAICERFIATLEETKVHPKQYDVMIYDKIYFKRDKNDAHTIEGMSFHGAFAQSETQGTAYREVLP